MAAGPGRTASYDRRRATLWVTLTGANRLVGMHVRDTNATLGPYIASVGQPNSVAVDDVTGEVIVTGSTPDGSLQPIR